MREPQRKTPAAGSGVTDTHGPLAIRPLSFGAHRKPNSRFPHLTNLCVTISDQRAHRVGMHKGARMPARAILLALAIVAILPRASAQEQQPQLIDRELKASYCLGYFEADQETRQRLCQKGQDTSKFFALCSTGAQSDTNRKRVKEYLATSGLMARLDAASAATQGRTDYSECVNWARSQAATDCTRGCPRDSVQQHLLCVSACKPIACRRVEECEVLNYLPN